MTPYEIIQKYKDKKIDYRGASELLVIELCIDSNITMNALANLCPDGYPETHAPGLLTMENVRESGVYKDVGVQVALDGRIWVCVDGISLLRFVPNGGYYADRSNGADEVREDDWS